MAYTDIQPPLVGEQQVIRVNGADVIVDLPTYLGYMNGNMNLTHGDLSPIYINGVAGESMTIPLLTGANVQVLNAFAVKLFPIVFPTAGTLQKAFTSTNKPGMITYTLTATFVSVVAQAGVNPAIGVLIEEQQVGGNWRRIPGFDSADHHTSDLTFTPYVAGNMVTLSLFRYWPDVAPNRNYRVTAMAGHFASAALPNTGQWKVDATGTNTLEFNAWGN